MSHATTADPTFEEHRAEIASLDRELVERIAERTPLGDGVATAKERAGLPTVDEARERAVTDGAAEAVREFDLDEHLTRAAFQLLIETSKVEQRERPP